MTESYNGLRNVVLLKETQYTYIVLLLLLLQIQATLRMKNNLLTSRTVLAIYMSTSYVTFIVTIILKICLFLRETNLRQNACDVKSFILVDTLQLYQ